MTMAKDTTTAKAKATANEWSPLLEALSNKRVQAKVVGIDQYHRTIRGTMVVKTDYIIRVEPRTTSTTISTNNNENILFPMEPFTLCKTYNDFWKLAKELQKIVVADKAMSLSSKEKSPLEESTKTWTEYCETFLHLIETQQQMIPSLGKVNYHQAKTIAKIQSLIMNECLEIITNYFPTNNNGNDENDDSLLHGTIVQLIETFFLTDHCIETSDNDDNNNNNNNKNDNDDNKVTTPTKSKKDNNEDDNKNDKNNTTTTTTTKNNQTKEAGRQPCSSNSSSPLNIEKTLEHVGQNVGNVLGTFGQTIRSTLLSGDCSDRVINNKVQLKIDTSDKTLQKTTTTTTTKTILIVPKTQTNRRSPLTRQRDEEALQTIGDQATLVILLDDTELSLSNSTRSISNVSSRRTKWVDTIETYPILFSLIGMTALAFLFHASSLSVTVDMDILIVLLWVCFCVGLQVSRPVMVGGGMDKPPTQLTGMKTTTTTTPPATTTPTFHRRALRRNDHGGSNLLRMSILSSPDAQSSTRSASSLMTFDHILEEGEVVDDDDESIEDLYKSRSPLPKFPDGAKIGSVLNCWSEPVPKNFKVRGPNYLADKIKIPSGPFVFPVRAVDLFLTDTCPENVGRLSGMLGGQLREKPTFIINFRLPWGILAAYFEIPERFIPFVRAGHEPNFDKSKLPNLDTLSNQDRCVARFLQGTVEHKNKTLKIVPMVVEGPWVVKSVVGGKPAIIGNKMPVDYYYQKTEDDGKKAMYLEADLDIVASSAARGILSVARAYTQVLTLDLGFVVQGNSDDELPEQMLIGCRLHGIDPLTAPPLPPSNDMFLHSSSLHGEEDDENNDSSSN